jgi:hypothetical protein
VASGPVKHFSELVHSDETVAGDIVGAVSFKSRSALHQFAEQSAIVPRLFAEIQQPTIYLDECTGGDRASAGRWLARALIWTGCKMTTVLPGHRV